MPESVARRELEDSQQQFNTTSTTIQQPKTVDLTENAHIQDVEENTEPQEFIQHITKDKGERGYVEKTQFDTILQTEQQVDSTTTQEDISSQQSNSQVHTSEQEAFQQKYQPVEVLNSEGKWVSGYHVHKCLVVANLVEIERKYALVDELGAKYVFWGKIRLPRVKK